MRNSNHKAKSDFLGMPYGTANGRLKKMIIFRMAQRLGEDVCFRCGKRIDEIDALSIEHKNPWLNRSVDLFWDLDNIAFSHVICNSIASEKRRIEVRDGMGWCWKCRQFKSVVEFHRNSSRDSGISCECKDCKSKLNITQRIKNRS
jgi:hypothetical protein